jgi:hypothetical protein
MGEIMSENIETPKLDELVKTYLTIRTARDNLAREFELKDSELEREMKELEVVMLDECNNMHADSIRTGNGTITKVIKEQYTCNNWDEFKDYIKEHNALELLHQRIHQTNFREHMANHEGEGMPPGISSIREFSVVVRKPTAK